MKGMDIFCASQAATAICLTIDQPLSSSSSSSSSAAIQLGGATTGSGCRAIDRYNPIIKDPRRIKNPLPLSPPKPPTPHQNQHRKKNSSSQVKDEREKKSSSSKGNDQKREKIMNGFRKSWSCTKPGEFITPPGSSRYLLSDDQQFHEALSDFEPVLKKMVAVESADDDNKSIAVKTDESSNEIKPPSLSPSQNQVVVLRVSLHCKGCEKKMRKHIQRMEGVTSFNIDFLAKKVTVEGNVTPLQVLENISKVKNAQLWMPSISSSSAPSSANFQR